MADKLSQSLDDIVKVQRANNRRVARGRRVVKSTKTTTSAGGVGKKTKDVKTAKTTKGVPPAANKSVKPTKGESKIVVTGLPSDVSEQQIKEYFAQTVGPVKKALLTYGPNGQSRGVATIIFTRPNSAVEAATTLNGIKIDERAIKIEVVLGANQTPAVAQVPSLGDRIAQPKGQPKSSTEAKSKPKSAVNKKTVKKDTKAQQKRGRNLGRGKPKTAEQLDAEMTDYFDNATNAATIAATNGDIE